MNLKFLSNSVLVSVLKSKVSEERKLLNEILELLYEVGRRQLYLEMAYSSLFEFCEKELGYSVSSTQRRLEAMRLLKSLPEENQIEIKSKINEGSLNLTHLSRAQGFFKMEAKENDKNYSLTEKIQVLEKLENKSKLEMEKELVKISPQTLPPRAEVIRPLTEDKASMTLTVWTALITKLQKLKHLKSHTNPNMSTEELIDLLVDREIKRLEPKAPRSNKTQPMPPAVMGSKSSRYIPASVKHKVWMRDQGKCTFVNKQTGEVCESMHFIQYDHIHEFSKGGTSTNPDNLRLLCGAHNRYRNQDAFRI